MQTGQLGGARKHISGQAGGDVVNTGIFCQGIENDLPDMQHEVSRGLSLALSSTPEMASKKLKLSVEVRQREQLLTADEQVPAASPSADEQLPAAGLSQEGLLQAVGHPVPHEPDGTAAKASAREEGDSSIIARVKQMLQSGRLQERRLDMYAGPYGYEVMSGGSSSQVAEHAARSLLYARLHGLEVVFAVHFMVRRTGDQRKPITFPAWPAMGQLNEQVSS